MIFRIGAAVLATWAFVQVVGGTTFGVIVRLQTRRIIRRTQQVVS